MTYAAPHTSFEARVDGFPTGLGGTVGVRIIMRGSVMMRSSM